MQKHRIIGQKHLDCVETSLDVAGAERFKAATAVPRSCVRSLKRGASTRRMQRPPELVPIPECGVKALESSGKLLHFGKIPKKIGQNSAKNLFFIIKIQQNSDIFFLFCVENQKKISNSYSIPLQ